jgi:hypothetical protein
MSALRDDTDIAPPSAHTGDDYNFGLWGNAMKLPRRSFLHLAAGAAALPSASRMARALSSKNVVLVDNCKSLQNLTVILHATVDLVTVGNNGFSLQLNCYPQTKPQATYRDKPLKWFQYVIAVEDNSVQWGVQYWSETKGFGFSPANNYSSFGSAPSNQVPAGSVMKIALVTDANGNVTSAAFSMTDPKGTVSSHTFPFPSNALCAIYGFQVDLVGPPSGTHTCTFTSGVGVLTYGVSAGTLAVQDKNTCGGSQLGTAETSNIVYGDVVPASGQQVFQLFVG